MAFELLNELIGILEGAEEAAEPVETEESAAEQWYVCSESGKKIAGPFDDKEKAEAELLKHPGAKLTTSCDSE